MGQQTIINILPNELITKTLDLKNNGYRLVAVTCTSKDENELSYSFDKEHDFINLRLNIGFDVEIESISLIYSYAFFYENEIKELFGINIKNIALDFKGNLYKIQVKTPFSSKKEEA